MLRTIPLAALAALLAACASGPAISVACVPVKPYTGAQQAQMAKELQALPDGSMIAQAITDYGQMRAAARTCARVKTP